jgi:hypothetical protein
VKLIGDSENNQNFYHGTAAESNSSAFDGDLIYLAPNAVEGTQTPKRRLSLFRV